MRAILGNKVSPEELAQVLALLPQAAPAVPPAADDAPAVPPMKDTPPPFAAPKATAPKAEDAEPEDDDSVTKPAMDAAINAAVTAANSATLGRLQALNDAQEAVRPFLGSVRVNLAQDSAASVYRMALDHWKTEGHAVDLTGVPDAALGAVFRSIAPSIQAASSRPRAPVGLAADSATATDFAKRFPAAALARVI